MDKEFLSSLNPIFKLKDVKIFWSGTVYKVGQTNCLQPRILVIATPGIFLIRKKPFFFSSKIITAISFFDLISLYLTEQYASFSSKLSQIRVKLQNIHDIASIIFFIRQAQFPTDVLPFNISFATESLGNILTPAQLPYQSSTLFLDRMLSCILHYNINVNAFLLSQIPTPQFRTYKITSEMLNTPLFQAWILSLSYDQDIETLIIDSITLKPLLDQCSFLFTYNKFVRKIKFINVNFENTGQVLSHLFSQPHYFKPTHWIFIDCDLSKPSFNQFFDSIALIDKQISSIQFFNCFFSENSFTTLFQSIFFNDVFHSIKHLSFDYINFNEASNVDDVNSKKDFDHHLISYHISETLYCSWALQQKCIRTLSIIGSGVKDMTSFLAQPLSFDAGIQKVILEDNSFHSIFSIPENLKTQLSFISFKNGHFSSEFLKSFIQCLSHGQIQLKGLDFSHITIENHANLEPLLNQLENCNLPYLESLFFNDNPLNSSQTIQFTNFLKRHPKLTNLAINNTIDLHDSSSGFNYFSEYVKTQKLTALSINFFCDQRSQNFDFCYGQLMVNLLSKITSIEYLDITNQQVGQEGLEQILNYVADGQLKELYFNGSHIQSLDFLVSFCESLLISKLKFATFPIDDFKSAIEKVSENVDYYQVKMSYLQEKFEMKYGDMNKNVIDSIKKRFLSNKSQKKQKVVQFDVSDMARIGLDGVYESIMDDHIYGSKLKELYHECAGNGQPQKSVVELAETVENSLSFDYLLKLNE